MSMRRHDRGFSRKVLTASLICSLALMVLVPSTGLAVGTLVDLSALTGRQKTVLTGINDFGEVVGYAYNEAYSNQMYGFVYRNGTITSLGTLGGDYSQPKHINNSGQITGFSPMAGLGYVSTFLYSNGTMNDIGALLGAGYGGINAYPTGLNNKGQVVGRWNPDVLSSDKGFFYDNGTMKGIGTLHGLDAIPLGINDSGQIVGVSGERAFLYSNDVMTDLGTLPGGDWSRATAINNLGQIVGAGSVTHGYVHAFLYDDGVMKDLGTLWGTTNSLALDLNDAGQVVGTSDGYPFLYSNGTMEDLRFAYGWDFTFHPWAINNKGQIIGEMGAGTSRAFLYTPEPVPESSISPVLGICLISLAFLRRRIMVRTGIGDVLA